MGRRASREFAMKLLYQLEIQKEDRNEQIDDAISENDIPDKDRKYIMDIIDGVNNNIAYIDEIIEKNAKGWKISRLPKIDLSILRLCIYEISFRDDIPFNVSVNEAIELAKKFSSEEAGSFINGVLGSVTKANLPTSEDSK